MDEFDFISTYFKPLASGYSGSLGLSDDAALVSVPAGRELVITKDAICEGVHYLGTEDPALIARKLLRANLSDLAAKGATPLIYFLALMLPGHTKADWFERFAGGLLEDQSLFSIQLAGGDTTATRGMACFSLTALGTVAKGTLIKRSGAKVGDTVFVSGTLGDSTLGLGLLQNKIKAALSSENRHWLEHRYYLPEPRIALGQGLRDFAHAAMDISDGLVQDLEHLCKASGTGAVIHRHLLPLSAPAKRLVEHDGQNWMSVLAGGDDYELLFTAPARKQSSISRLSKELGIAVTAIGTITKGSAVQVLDESEKPITITRKGYRHFS